MALEDEEDEQQQQPKGIKTSHSSGTSEDPPSVPTLPPEIVVDILSRLPVESLLRFRSVCKLWRSLISDPHFVKSHLNLSTSNSHYAHHRLIFCTDSEINLKCCPLYNVLYDKSVDAVELNYPLKDPYTPFWIAGSCNGLLCIAFEEAIPFIGNPTTRRWNSLLDRGEREGSGEEDILFIGNPMTRRWNWLLQSGVREGSGWYVWYGFGYDESTDDYKVVVIFWFLKNGGSCDTEVKMYSLKNGNWKRIGEFPHGIPLDDSGKFLNGALHWAARRDFGSSCPCTIVSLDLAKETYGVILQPAYDEGNFDLTLGVLGEWLCVLCNYRDNRADVWGMKAYGVTDSWAKLVSIPYVTDPGWDQFSVPLCITNDGKYLLQFGSKLVLYDAKDGSSSEIQNFDECLEAYSYVESLVSPDAPSRPWR